MQRVDKIVHNFGVNGIDPGGRNKTTELDPCLAVSCLNLRKKRGAEGRQTPWHLVLIQVGEFGGSEEQVANSSIFYALRCSGR